MWRRTITVGVLLLVVLLAAGELINRWSESHSLLEIGPVLDEPSTYCEVHELESFTHRIRAVESTVRSGHLLEPATAVEAGFIRRAAKLSDTPGSLRSPIRELAALVEAGSTSHEYRDAYDLAAFLDRASAEHCG